LSLLSATASLRSASKEMFVSRSGVRIRSFVAVYPGKEA